MRDKVQTRMCWKDQEREREREEERGRERATESRASESARDSFSRVSSRAFKKFVNYFLAVSDTLWSKSVGSSKGEEKNARYR